MKQDRLHEELMIERCLSAAIIAALALAGPPAAAAGQENPQKLFEAGKYQGVIDLTPEGSPPEALYLKGLAHQKLNQADAARHVFHQLGGGEDWQAIGASMNFLMDGNLDGALEAAKTAVTKNPGLSQAHYQLGLTLEARGESPAAAEAFAAAAAASPQMAYAHYNAGMNYYKAKRIDRMAVYFENFLKLAPNAPERPAVESIMRTLRGR
jgi:tetratricopeptide (TPR) repeat protein